VNGTKLFKDFGQTSVKPTAGEKSTGLGLAICKRIMESTAAPLPRVRPAGGSIFRVTFPRPLLAHELPPDHFADRRRGSHPEIPSPYPEKFDNPKLIEAPDGLQAVQLYKQNHPDLVLLDVNMPNMDGVQALAESSATIPTPSS